MPHVGDILLGRLRVVSRLGAGGAGDVFEVEHIITGQHRALKVLHASLATSSEAVARMVREAKIATQVKSPRVVEIVDAGRLDDGSVFLLQELLSGEPARALVGSTPPPDQRLVAEIGRQAAEGLAAVHEAGLLHRDVKPDNLFVSRDERGRPSVRLIDFGLTKPMVTRDLLGSLTPDGKAPGTVRYLAPEVEVGWSARTDIYALGVTMYELLCGAPPYDGPTSAAVLLEAHKASPTAITTLRPDVDDAIGEIVMRAMSHDPDRRPVSARALSGELAAWCIDRDAAMGTLESVPTLATGYDVVRRIGRGATSVVVSAVQKKTGRHVALKLLEAKHQRDPEMLARFEREAKLLAAIDSPEVAGILDAGICADSGVPFLVLELAPGDDLGELVRRSGPLALEDVLSVVEDVARGLEAAHAASVLHRDLKPGNLRAHRDDHGRLCTKIVDFGIGKRFDEGAEQTVGGLGTPAYMAPEQLDPKATLGPAVDVHALGHVAYTLLVGEPYFQPEVDAGAMALVAKLASATREPASQRAREKHVGLPPGFDAWFARATHPSPSARFESPRVLAAALAGVLSASGTSRTVTWAPKGASKGDGKWWLAGAAVATLASAAWFIRAPAAPTPDTARAPQPARSAVPLPSPAASVAPETSATPAAPSASAAVVARPAPTPSQRVASPRPSSPAPRAKGREETLY